jgi:hypothetical protein
MTEIWSDITRDGEDNAYFAAGHAVVAWLDGLEIVHISIGSADSPCSWIDVSEPDSSMACTRA